MNPFSQVIERLAAPWRATRYPRELGLLFLLVLVLPILEAPKNLAWLLWVLTWLGNRWRTQDFGGPWGNWDTLFAIWLGSPVLVQLGGAYPGNWRDGADVLRYVSLGWLLMRSGYGRTEWRAIGLAGMLSLLIGIAWALLDWGRPHSYEGIQLPSVGHVNHTGIYLVIAFGALAGAACALWSQLGSGARWLFILTVGSVVIALLLSGSRAAAAFMLAFALLIGAVWWQRSRWPLVIMAALAIFSTVLLYGYDQDMRRKFAVAHQSETGLLYARAEIWRQALEAVRAHPWFGVGLENFKKIDSPTVQRWVEQRGEPFQAEKFRSNPHAHNLYLNLLAERGWVGAAMALMPLLAALLLWLRTWPRASEPPERWGLWIGAASGLGATLGIGFLNTTLHHEHGLLTMLLLGFWLNGLRQSGHRAFAARTPQLDTAKAR